MPCRRPWSSSRSSSVRQGKRCGVPGPGTHAPRRCPAVVNPYTGSHGGRLDELVGQVLIVSDRVRARQAPSIPPFHSVAKQGSGLTPRNPRILVPMRRGGGNCARRGGLTDPLTTAAGAGPAAGWLLAAGATARVWSTQRRRCGPGRTPRTANHRGWIDDGRRGGRARPDPLSAGKGQGIPGSRFGGRRVRWWS
jgi:hypothetical protein